MEIVLARHGETDWNLSGRLMGRRDVPLNENGRKQAETLRDKLVEMDFDCCYSSPLVRARETAEIVCDGKCEVVYDDNLMERHGGGLEGKIVNNWGDFEKDETIETDAEILARARQFLKMLEKTGYKRVLVVSHNGLLKNLRYCILGEVGELDYSKGNFENCGFEILESV